MSSAAFNNQDSTEMMFSDNDLISEASYDGGSSVLKKSTHRNIKSDKKRALMNP
jgi:hypothetical protein